MKRVLARLRAIPIELMSLVAILALMLGALAFYWVDGIRTDRATIEHLKDAYGIRSANGRLPGDIDITPVEFLMPDGSSSYCTVLGTGTDAFPSCNDNVPPRIR